MKSCIIFSLFLFASGISFAQIHEKPVIADYSPNIPEELIEGGKLSQFVALSLPEDDRWNPDNSNLNANGAVFAIGQGESYHRGCYLGGHFDSIGGIAASRIAFFEERSQPNFTEVSGGIQGGDVYSILEVDNSDELYVGGNFTKAGDIEVRGVAHWTGAKWENLDGGMDSTVLTLALIGNHLYAGGNFHSAGRMYANYIAVMDTATKSWEPILDGNINGMNGGVNAITLSTSGTIYVGGGFTKAGSVTANKIASYDGKWHDMQGGVQGPNAYVTSIKDAGSNILVGGSFQIAGSRFAGNIASWNGKAWRI
jgi:hypothetical protein